MALRAHRIVRGLALATLVGSVQGCLGWGPISVEPPPAPASLEAGLDVGVADAISESMPEVSYEPENPAMRDPLGREDVHVVRPTLETQGGDDKIVCLKTTRHVYGRCAFPVSPAP